MYWVNKFIQINESLNLWAAHIVDDDCVEYIAIVRAPFVTRKYYDANDLNVIDREEYSADTWLKLEWEQER